MAIRKKEPTYVIDNLSQWEIRDIVQALKDYQDFIATQSKPDEATDGRWGWLADRIQREFNASK